MRALALLLFLIPVTAQGSEIGDFFKGLFRPDTGGSCCDISDCRALNEEEWTITDGFYVVRIEGRPYQVPETKLLRRTTNPLKKAVLCYNAHPTVTIYCFLPWGART